MNSTPEIHEEIGIVLPNYSKPNRRVLVFVKWPDIDPEPQGAIILSVIRDAQRLTRGDLLTRLSILIDTKSSVSAVLSYQQRILVRVGAIKVEEPILECE